MKIDDNQFGRKVGKHAEDYGLDPKKTESRQWIKSHIKDIRNHPDEIRKGTWNGLGDGPPNARGRGHAIFFRKGEDVIVTDVQGNFVTILKDGVNNTSFRSPVI
jgi:filamentous hemagglutinin